MNASIPAPLFRIASAARHSGRFELRKLSRPRGVGVRRHSPSRSSGLPTKFPWRARAAPHLFGSRLGSPAWSRLDDHRWVKDARPRVWYWQPRAGRPVRARIRPPRLASLWDRSSLLRTIGRSESRPECFMTLMQRVSPCPRWRTPAGYRNPVHEGNLAFLYHVRPRSLVITFWSSNSRKSVSTIRRRAGSCPRLGIANSS